jgi:hypothetical protein
VIYLMANKSETCLKYKLYEALMLRQRDAHIKVLVSDRGANIQALNLNNTWPNKARSID